MVKFNKTEFKWLLVLIVFAYYLYTLLNTGNINLFIHPRMIKYVRFSLVVLLILSLFQLKRVFIITNNRKRKVYLGVFLFPLALGIFINPQGLSGEIAGKKGAGFMNSNPLIEAKSINLHNANVGNNSINKNSSSQINSTVSQNSTSNSNVPKSQINTNDLNSSNLDKSTGSNENNAMVVDTNNFTQVTDDMCYNDPNKYKGKKISITGFVYRDDTVSKNEFVVGRLMIVCCTADAEVAGVLCDWSKSPTLKNDQWVKVTGTIDSELHKFEGKDQMIPVIRVNHIEPIDKPKNQYIYPE